MDEEQEIKILALILVVLIIICGSFLFYKYQSRQYELESYSGAYAHIEYDDVDKQTFEKFSEKIKNISLEFNKSENEIAFSFYNHGNNSFKEEYKIIGFCYFNNGSMEYIEEEYIEIYLQIRIEPPNPDKDEKIIRENTNYFISLVENKTNEDPSVTITHHQVSSAHISEERSLFGIIIISDTIVIIGIIIGSYYYFKRYEKS